MHAFNGIECFDEWHQRDTAGSILVLWMPGYLLGDGKDASSGSLKSFATKEALRGHSRWGTGPAFSLLGTGGMANKTRSLESKKRRVKILAAEAWLLFDLPAINAVRCYCLPEIKARWLLIQDMKRKILRDSYRSNNLWLTYCFKCS